MRMAISSRPIDLRCRMCIQVPADDLQQYFGHRAVPKHLFRHTALQALMLLTHRYSNILLNYRFRLTEQIGTHFIQQGQLSLAQKDSPCPPLISGGPHPDKLYPVCRALMAAPVLGSARVCGTP